MNDNDVEDLLRRHRPAGPPQDLRARIMAAPMRVQRTWPWAATAAALLVAAISLTVASDIVRRRTVPPPAASADVEIASDALRALGFDDSTLRMMELKDAVRRRDVAESSAAAAEGLPR
jgi:hypothetical protein